MLPWKNSWFQIAFFAWLVSGALLIADYAPNISTHGGWMRALQRAPRQPSEAPAKPSPPSEQQSATKRPTPARQAPSPSPAKPATKTPNTSGTNAGSAEFAQGKAAYDRSDYAQAMEWYQKAAAHGNAEAENYIGWCYQNGFGVQKDFAEAMNWYKKAAAQGNSDAENNTGWFYQNGFGVQKDYAEAMKWYQKAAAQGNSEAENNTGWFYQNGFGVQKDYVEAMKWYQKSAAQGYSMAENNIGWSYQNGFGVQKDNAEAIRWYQKAAAQGNDFAKQNLASLQAGEDPSAMKGPTPAQPAPGPSLTWTDPSTGLMWTQHDNGDTNDLTWDQAVTYCQNLRLGGRADWRLPTIDELQGIFDSQENVNGKHIKGKLLISGELWSSSQKDKDGRAATYYNNPNPAAFSFAFDRGEREAFLLGNSPWMRALCVRSSGH
jgi:TPR repeat protein